MAGTVSAPDNHYDWSVQPEAARLVQELLQQAVEGSSSIRQLQHRLLRETGTRLIDWIAHFALPSDDNFISRMQESGFEGPDNEGAYRHAGGMFPAICMQDQRARQIFIKVESVADFVLAQRLSGADISNSPLSAIRTSTISTEGDWQCCVIERHGTQRYDLAGFRHEDLNAILRHGEYFALRQRHFEDPAEGFEHAMRLIRRAREELSADRVCDLFFAAERAYWHLRNRAARTQKARLGTLGMGWANHDHHTYRSSRAHFASLIAVLEELGFECREAFYAGLDAGWGAQVLEQSRSGVVVFADVDLSPEEVTGDFAHEPLPPRDELGTVGLWCRLHGEAFLEAGMHHLECQFDFDAAREQLREIGVETMKPFTDLPHLKQAFTVGEIWPVSESRIDSLLKDGLISEQQAEKFRNEGALGSHLEILQREEGYKGFNQTGINDIIRMTDPRRSGEK